MLIYSLRRKIEAIKEEVQKEDDEGSALDFFVGKQVVLSSYFQLVNMLILKRLNGLHSDSQCDTLDEQILKEFEINGKPSTWGNSRYI